MLAFQDRRGSVEVAFTDRFGGVSTGPYAELSLKVPAHVAARTAEHTRLTAEVAANLDLVAAAVARDAFDGLRGIVVMHQVHGATVVVDPGVGEPECDGVVADEPGWLLAARAADCVPVMVADPVRGLVAAAHAGRQGLVAGVVPNAVAALRERGATELVAWIGPHACGRCYEVPAAMRASVAEVVPAAFSETSWGTPAVDLGAGVRAQLVEAGAEVVEFTPCTIEDERFYSFRREGEESGRHAGLVWVRP
ncbi:polyphenol oxidase family protein [Nocardioides caldifontis]|uniref:polyphenol oxidase family protein n=1 Tax=Nocardioides caldifontis TaxID=2588938 RepID=UPI0011DF267A|nr:polyphenol oxidase family protein [Nocardioides caldifontis]